MKLVSVLCLILMRYAVTEKASRMRATIRKGKYMSFMSTDARLMHSLSQNLDM